MYTETDTTGGEAAKKTEERERERARLEEGRMTGKLSGEEEAAMEDERGSFRDFKSDKIRTVLKLSSASRNGAVGSSG